MLYLNVAVGEPQMENRALLVLFAVLGFGGVGPMHALPHGVALRGASPTHRQSHIHSHAQIGCVSYFVVR
jgi:hypothetical protein